MTSPAGCDQLPPTQLPTARSEAIAPDLFAGLLPATDLPTGDAASSFEELLEDETSEVPPPAESKTSSENSINLLPFFTTAIALVLQPAQTSTEASDSGAETPATAIENKLPPESGPTENQPEESEQIAERPLKAKHLPHGMPVAKQPAMIFTTSMTEESAGTASEPKLPLGVEYVESPSFEKEIKGEAKSPKQQAKEAKLAIEPLPETSAIRMDRAMASEKVGRVAETHHATPKIVDELSNHVQVLRTTSQDRLEVVLRPDTKTELYLEITKANGLIQIHARCDLENFARLDAHWNTVQSSLAAQGIRVESLQPTQNLNAQDFSSGGQGSHNSAQQQRDQAEPQDFQFEQDTPIKSHAKPASNREQKRGWQRWA